MSQHWTRDELSSLVAARRRVDAREGNERTDRNKPAPPAFIEFRMRVTPELLEAMLGGTWTNADGSAARFDGVRVTDEGYVEPILTRIVRQS